MIDITISKINESVLEVRGSEDILHDLYSRYSEYQAGYQFNPRFKNRIWDGKIHLFNIRTGILPAGFLIDLLMYCKQNNVNYELDGFRLEDLKEPLDEQQYLEEIENNMEDSGKTLRDYQDQAVRKALTYRKGILLSCTGSGKSLMLYNIIRCLRKRNFKKILLIVPNIILISQMRNDFVEYGYPDADSEITMLGGGNKPDFSCPVLISTWESLQNKESTFFEDFDAVFVDECVNGDTLISTPNGDKKIKDIKEGELVITYNEKTKNFEPNRVLEVHHNHNSSKNAKMLRLELEDGKVLELTENHPVYTTNRGWVRAGELKDDDDIEVINNLEVSEDTSII